MKLMKLYESREVRNALENYLDKLFNSKDEDIIHIWNEYIDDAKGTNEDKIFSMSKKAVNDLLPWSPWDVLDADEYSEFSPYDKYVWIDEYDKIHSGEFSDLPIDVIALTYYIEDHEYAFSDNEKIVDIINNY